MARTITRWLEDVAKGRRRIRVVVLGSAMCGKTVFLTSLAKHLRHHDPESFKLNGWEASWEDGLLSAEGVDSLPRFPYDEYRKGFEKQIPEFPAKTTAEMSVLRLPLELRKNGIKDTGAVLLELMDLPGERVADLVMADRSYREWCEWMYDSFVNEELSDSYRDYLEKIKTACNGEELFEAYKAHLVSEANRFSPWITPSRVKLVNGSAKKFLQEVENRLLGVDSDSQFVPLPLEAFDSSHPLNRFVKGFETGYCKYRQEVVRPIADWLADANQLVYLVDVLGILKKGVPAYNAEKAFGTAVIGRFRTRKTRMFGGGIVDWLSGLFTTKLERAYLVATKADLAYGMEGRENMCNLANKILGKAVRNLGLDSAKVSVRACAAVNTVDDRDADNVRARQDASSNDEKEYSRLVVPERWPESRDWKSENYWFEDTFPRIDGRSDAAPPQMGLDDLTRAILEEYVG